MNTFASNRELSLNLLIQNIYTGSAHFGWVVRTRFIKIQLAHSQPILKYGEFDRSNLWTFLWWTVLGAIKPNQHCLFYGAETCSWCYNSVSVIVHTAEESSPAPSNEEQPAKPKSASRVAGWWICVIYLKVLCFTPKTPVGWSSCHPLSISNNIHP